MDLITQILICFLGSVVVMIATWLVCIRINNGGWVDVVWAFSIGLLSTVHLLLNLNTPAIKLAWLLMALWSIRLGLHLAKRIATETEDGRYQALKQKWGGIKSPKMFAFFMIQAFAAFLFSLPALIGIRNGDTIWNWNEWFALGIAIIAILGESIADAQLKSFKKRTKDPQAVCNVGLWKYSRHPNYFFEWIYWFSFPLLVIESSSFWTLLLAPVVMLILVTKVTGIPPTEAQAIRKRGERYKQYQKETSAFIPWAPKRRPESSS